MTLLRITFFLEWNFSQILSFYDICGISHFWCYLHKSSGAWRTRAVRGAPRALVGSAPIAPGYFIWGIWKLSGLEISDMYVILVMWYVGDVRVEGGNVMMVMIVWDMWNSLLSWCHYNHAQGVWNKTNTIEKLMFCYLLMYLNCLGKQQSRSII